MIRPSLVVGVVVAITSAVSAAGPDATFATPRTENGRPDLRGVWNFSSDVPLQRPMSVGDRRTFTVEEIEQRRAAKAKALDTVSNLAPVEAIGISWLDYRSRIQDLRTSLITYPADGRLPKLVDGVRRAPSVDEILEALADAKGSIPPALAAFMASGRTDSFENFTTAARCLFGGGPPLEPDIDGNFVQIVQSRDSVAIRSERLTRLVPLDGRPPLSEKLRTWAGDARGHWEGDTLVVETRNFNGRTNSFVGAGTARDKTVTERFTRVGANTLDYEATIADPKTFQDRIVIAFPMAKVDARLYEFACHEGNYSMPNVLSAARKND